MGSLYISNCLKVRRVGKGYLFENGIGLNETAYRIYEMCQNKIGKEDIIKKLESEYDVAHINKETLIDDINECISELLEAGLIRVDS